MARPGVRSGALVTAKPPTVACLLISLASPAQERDAAIGDLEEEFLNRASSSPKNAGRWYWRQAITSVPQFCANRIRQPNAVQFYLLVLITMIAYVGITFWDIEVARRATRTTAGLISGAPLVAMRGFYILVQAIGFALAGGVIAFFTFRRSRTFLQNMISRLAPLALILFAPPLAMSLFSDSGYPLAFRLPWFAMTATALFAGAWIGEQIPRK